jgi:hypothetical protein
MSIACLSTYNFLFAVQIENAMAEGGDNSWWLKAILNQLTFSVVMFQMTAFLLDLYKWVLFIIVSKCTPQ